MRYKALTLTPPWGTLIAIGAKKIETRDWPTQHRGPLLIHQGTNLKPIGGIHELSRLCAREPFCSVLEAAGYNNHRMPAWGLPMGKIVAVCELIGIIKTRSFEDSATQYYGYPEYGWTLTDTERAFGNYSPGRYAWLLADIRALPTPIAARGLPGLWDWEGELEI